MPVVETYESAAHVVVEGVEGGVFYLSWEEAAQLVGALTQSLEQRRNPFFNPYRIRYIAEVVATTLDLQADHIERSAKLMVGLPGVCTQLARDLRAESKKLREAAYAPTP